MKGKKRESRREGGFIVALELLFISVILVIGLVVGMVSVRDAVNTEMLDLSEAIGSIDQSFTYSGAQNIPFSASVEGSDFADAMDAPFDSGVGLATLEYTQIAPDDEDTSQTIP